MSEKNEVTALERQLTSDKQAAVLRTVLAASLVTSFAMFAWLLIKRLDPVQMGAIGDFNEIFCDFFWSVVFNRNKDPYFSGESVGVYAPLAQFIYFVFSKFANHRQVARNIWECFQSPLHLMAVTVYITICVSLMIGTLQCFARRLKLWDGWAFVMCFTFAFVFALERGNFVMVMAAAMYFFLAFYDSEDKRMRTLAALVLAFAASTKMYPAVLGMLYLRKRQWREIIISALLTLLLLFLPFLFFKHGFGNIPKLVSNIKQYNKVFTHWFHFMYGYSTIFEWLLFPHSTRLASMSIPFFRFADIVLIALSLFLVCFEKRAFCLVVLICVPNIFIPTDHSHYCGLYLMPIMISYVATLRNRSIAKNIVLCIMMFFMLSPLQYGFPCKDDNIYPYARISFVWVSLLMNNICATCLWLFAIITSAMQFVRSLRQRQAVKAVKAVKTDKVVE